MIVAVLIERAAVDVLHDEIRALARKSTIDDLCDARVMKRSENPSLSQEALMIGVIPAAPRDDLDCDQLIELPIVSPRQKNQAHSATSQDPLRLERAKARQRGGYRRLLDRC